MTLDEAILRYGEIADGKWPSASLWVVKYELPEEIPPHLVNTATGNATEHIYVNRDMIPALDKAFSNVISRGLIDQLVSFDGCFEIRSVRGFSASPSCHSYALAIDINAGTNKLGTAGDISPELVACFKDAGFDWGGEFSTRQDPMHFSFGWEGPDSA